MKKSKSRKYTLTGILVVLILAVSYWGLNYLKGIDLFNKQNTYNILYNRIDGLSVSSPVNINGYKVGQVTNIKMLHDNNSMLLVTIETRGEFTISDSSIARIYSIDLMGTKGIEIILSNNNRLLEENDTIQGSIEQSLKDQVSMQMLPIKTQAEDLMKEMESAIAVVRYVFNEETRINLQHSFVSIKKAVSYLESSTQNLDSLMIQEKTRIARILQYTENITANINNNSDAITNALTNISEFSDTLKTIDIANTVNEANKVITDIGLITDKINNGEGSLGLLINDDSLYSELEKASVNLDKLIWDMRANPERYINIKLIDFGREVHVIDESLLKKREKKILEKKRKSLQ